MAGYDDNVYYHPEKSGLATLGEVEWSDGAYSFDLTVAWRHQDGRLFWGDDAGCSCPSPFEDVNSLDDLATGSAADLQAVAERTFAALAQAVPVRADQIEGGLIQAADVLLAWLRGLGAQVDIGYDVLDGQAELVATWPTGRTIELGPDRSRRVASRCGLARDRTR